MSITIWSQIQRKAECREWEGPTDPLVENVYLDSLKTQRFSFCSEEILKLKKESLRVCDIWPGNVFIGQKSKLAAWCFVFSNIITQPRPAITNRLLFVDLRMERVKMCTVLICFCLFSVSAWPALDSDPCSCHDSEPKVAARCRMADRRSRNRDELLSCWVSALTASGLLTFPLAVRRNMQMWITPVSVKSAETPQSSKWSKHEKHSELLLRVLCKYIQEFK